MKDYGTESGICSIISGEEAAGAGQISVPAVSAAAARNSAAGTRH